MSSSNENNANLCLKIIACFHSDIHVLTTLRGTLEVSISFIRGSAIKWLYCYCRNRCYSCINISVMSVVCSIWLTSRYRYEMCIYRQNSNISRTKSQNLIFFRFVLQSYLPYWSHVLSREWIYSWRTADRRTSSWTYSRYAGHLRRHGTHIDVTRMFLGNVPFLITTPNLVLNATMNIEISPIWF